MPIAPSVPRRRSLRAVAPGGLPASVPCAVAFVCLASLAAGAQAARPADAGRLPAALTHPLRAVDAVARHAAPAIDVAALRAEDAQRERAGLPPRFAIPDSVALTPLDAGTWEDLDARRRVWRLRVATPGALSLNLGFTGYRLPKGGRLCVYPLADPAAALVYDETDNKPHGQLWTPVVRGDELVVELTLPRDAPGDWRLELGSVNAGYRGFFADRAGKSGACNIDVVCPEGDAWRDEIQTVAAISTGGSIYCSGFMINNTALDARPLFMTANHCNVTAISDASLVVYWNYQSPTCGQHGGGDLTQFQNGSTLLATYTTSDFTLVELDDTPDPQWQVAFAGWDRTARDPEAAVGIHHPSGDEKSISFEDDPLQTASYLGYDTPGNGTHLRVVDWDAGTTEGGSSGSPLFDPEHRVVGQLHGGYAACNNDLSDWYGRLSVSWEGGGTAASRLRDWLDPLGEAPVSLDLYAPYRAGLRVTPSADLSAAGDPGGPFAPSGQQWTVANAGTSAIAWRLDGGQAPWLTVDRPAGATLDPGETAQVTVTINALADDLPAGVHADTLRFVNETDGTGDTVRAVRLQVGQPEVAYAWSFDTDPGWSAEGQWAFGAPAGGGGEYGGPDPAAGRTGASVYGYNLAGDYAANLPEQHLTTPPLDCSGLSTVTLRFWRWLGVEQASYDRASLRVSTDGATWTTVWQNQGEVADAAWTLQEFDLTALAAGRDAVRLRWTMGPTDGSWNYCGWNLDDVEVLGFPGETPPPVPARTALLPNVPNPFNPGTEVRFELARAGRARLTVHDLRGRFVRELLVAELPAARHAVTWDGRDADGRPVASGAYVLRLEGPGAVVERKVTVAR